MQDETSLRVKCLIVYKTSLCMKIKLKIDFLNKEPVEGNPQTNKTQVDKSKTNRIPSLKTHLQT